MALCEMTGRIHSVQSLGTVDGPGLRSVVFFQGCPLRCACCHNPDTWDPAGGREVTVQQLAKQLLRFRDYWKNGGVTASGGEPLLQAGFVKSLFAVLKQEGVHTALDTSGCVWNAETDDLLDVTDLVLLDVKMPTEVLYGEYVGGSLSQTMDFLVKLQERKMPTWLRQVIIPDITDTEESLRMLWETEKRFSCVERTELLPFRKLCTEKYASMGIKFPLAHLPETASETVERLKMVWNTWNQEEK